MRDEQKGIWIVGLMAQGVLSFSTSPRQHQGEAEAAREAQRLGIENPGKTFVIAKIEKKVTASSIVWEKI